MAVFDARMQYHEQRRGPRTWPVLLPWLLPLGVVVGLAVYVFLTPYRSHKLPPPGKHGRLVWGDGVFQNTIQMRGWLHLHGGRYRVWAKHHPAALKLITPLPRKVYTPVTYRARLNGVCRSYAPRFKRLEVQMNAARTAGNAQAAYIAVSATLRAGLNENHAIEMTRVPPALRAQMAPILVGLRGSDVLIRRALADAARGGTQAFARDIAQGNKLAAPLNLRLKAAGLGACASS